MEPIVLEIPENTLWTDFTNGYGQSRKGWVVVAKEDDKMGHFKKGPLYQLVFQERGDPDYHDGEINAQLFKDGRKLLNLFWRNWQSLDNTFEFVPRRGLD